MFATFDALFRYLVELLVRALDLDLENTLLIGDACIIELLECGPENKVIRCMQDRTQNNNSPEGSLGKQAVERVLAGQVGGQLYLAQFQLTARNRSFGHI